MTRESRPAAAALTDLPAKPVIGDVTAAHGTLLADLLAHPTRPRPFLLDADNRHAGHRRTVAEAIATGRAYAVELASDVLAIDLDQAEARPSLDRFADDLAAEGWPVLRAESGSPGHRHLWAVVPDPDARERLTSRAVSLGLPAPRSPMRPPGTPHRLGLPVRLVDDPDTFRAAVVAIRGTERPDHLDWRDLLHSGRWPNGRTGDSSGSSMVWNICIGAHRAGHDLAAVRSMLANPANRGGRAYRDRLNRPAKSHADHWLDCYVWPEAVKAAGQRPEPPADAHAARERLDSITEAMNAHRWAGKGGATDRAVIVALVARGHARGTLTSTMSHRELAEAAPCHRNTVARAVARLRKAGWLQTVKQGRGRTVTDADRQYQERADATRWRLTLPARAADTGGTPQAGTPLSVTTSRGQSRAVLDACRWGGLGLNTPRVLDALAAGPLTDAALADRLILNRGNLRYRLLPRLADFDLIVRADDGWHLAENLDTALEAAADALELTGKADTVAAQHAAERAAYLDHRERTRSSRDAATRRRLTASTAARRNTGTEALPLWPDRPVEAAEPASTAPPGLPPPDPVEAALAPLSGSGGGHAN